MKKNKKHFPLKQTKFVSTMNYDQFKLIMSNREVDMRHVKRLAAKIAEKNLLHLYPISVNKDFEIFDGQHRLEAARMLKIPIYYAIENSLSKRDISEINSGMKNWNMKDFVNFFRLENTEGFDRLSNFMNRYPKLKLSSVLILLSSDGTRNSRNLKEGLCNVANYDKAIEIMTMISDLIALEYKFVFETSFIAAFRKMVDSKLYEHKVMMRQIEKQPRSFVRCIDTKQYIEMMTELYNYQMRTKINFVK